MTSQTAQLTEAQLTLAALVAEGKIKGDFAADISSKPLFSEKQHAWVQRLIDQATAAPLNVQGISTLFTNAINAGLKTPKIRLSAAGNKIVLSRAGSRSKNPGVIYITDGVYQGSYYGKITLDGEVFLARDSNHFTSELNAVLTALSNDPAGTAAAYGRLTGNCCFCSRELSDERSTSVGYGPICAERFGLAWGN